jgi:hypothetical protein
MFGQDSLSVLSNDAVICYDYTTPVVDERVWDISEIIQTGEYRSTWRKTCPNTNSSATNPTSLAYEVAGK